MQFTQYRTLVALLCAAVLATGCGAVPPPASSEAMPPADSAVGNVAEIPLAPPPGQAPTPPPPPEVARPDAATLEKAAAEAPAAAPPPAATEETTAPAVQNGLQNGSFEAEVDAKGDLVGWTVAFDDWGSGEASASWGLSKEADNDPNTTRKLGLYNGTAQTNRFTLAQTIAGIPAGSYTLAFSYEGADQNPNTGVTVSANGVTTPLPPTTGWKNWKQLRLDDIQIAAGETVTIQIEGPISSKGWMDFDDFELTLTEKFVPKSF